MARHIAPGTSATILCSNASENRRVCCNYLGGFWTKIWEPSRRPSIAAVSDDQILQKHSSWVWFDIDRSLDAYREGPANFPIPKPSRIGTHRLHWQSR